VPISFVLLGVFAYRPLVAYRPILASIDSFGGNSGGNFLNETMPRDGAIPMTDKKPEKPRSEPEIIPPGRAQRDAPRVHVFVGTHGTERVYVGKASPLGIILVTLITGLLTAGILVLLLGAFLFLLPLAVLLVTGLVVAGLVRFYFQRRP
jgi:hypothetical protein